MLQAFGRNSFVYNFLAATLGLGALTPTNSLSWLPFLGLAVPSTGFRDPRTLSYPARGTENMLGEDKFIAYPPQHDWTKCGYDEDTQALPTVDASLPIRQKVASVDSELYVSTGLPY